MDSIYTEVQLKLRKIDNTYGIVKTFIRDKKIKLICIKGKTGEILFEESEIAIRWKEYLEQYIVKKKIRTHNEMKIKKKEGQLNLEDEYRSIIKEVLEKALNEFKYRKCQGVDDMPVEFIKKSGENINNMLYN